MNFPDKATVKALLDEAEKMNPGKWVAHSLIAGECAEKIASGCGLNSALAYSLGALHDIGRRFGVTNMLHATDGFRFMTDLGYDINARICLSHSFLLQTRDEFLGENDLSPEDDRLLDDYLSRAEYDDYDRLIQLCDYLSYPDGACRLEVRMVDVTMRRGFNSLTVDKWKRAFEIKNHFDNLANCDIYKLINV